VDDSGVAMVRTVISLDEKDKRWLDRQAARRKVAMTALVREAVGLLRREESVRGRPSGDVIERTRGIWRRGDGLAWQNRLRDDW
jgi:hypothetical protein